MKNFSKQLRQISCKILFALMFSVLISCNTLSTSSEYRNLFSVSGGSYSNPYGVRYAVHIDEYTEGDVNSDILAKYVSYPLQYRGFSETTKEENADYVISVRYIGPSSNPEEQTILLMAYSKRVFDAIGRAEPAWVAKATHRGIPQDKRKLLAMLISSIKNFAGGNPSDYEKNQHITSDSKIVSDIYNQVEVN